jgi:5-methylcytosine-specific restriction endonuclease McrA
MARKPDVVCAGQCGRLLWRGRGSRPNPTCRECRKIAPTPYDVESRKGAPVGTIFMCEMCSGEFTSGESGRSQVRRFCSVACYLDAFRRWPNQTERYRAKTHARRARLRGVESEPYTTIEIAERDGFVCQLCLGTVDTDLPGSDAWGPTVDHRIPLARGGDDTRSNVQLAHRTCNGAKGVRYVA